MRKNFFVVAAIFFSSPLLSQQDTTVQSLNEVTVTATRFPKKISETGKVVNIITRAELERVGGKDLSQVLNEQAGLLINGSTSNPGKDKSVYLRGAKGTYTLILINGIPVNDPTGVGGAFDLRMLPVEQIERIEILKGAQSTLYGSDAIAGAINIITKKGDGKPVTLYGGFSIGNFNTIKASGGLSGNTEGTSYNVIFSHNESKGVSEAKDTSATEDYPSNGFNQNALNIDFDGRVLKGLHVKPFLRYNYFNGTYPGGAFTPGQDKFKSQLLSTGSQVQYSYLHGSVTALLSYDEISRSFENSFGLSSYDGNKTVFEIFSHYEFGKHFGALAGLRHDRQLMKKPAPGIDDTTANLTSPYLSLFLKNLGGFNFEAGIRYNKHSIYGSTTTYSLNPSFLIGNKLKLFANYGTAFKAPGLYELFGEYVANPDLKGEKSKTIEGGFQTWLFNQKLDLRVVYFDRVIKNQIVYGPSFTYINYDKQDDHGFEVEPTIRFNDRLTLKMFYSYVDGEVTTKSGSKDTTFYNLIRRPKHSFAGNLGYQLTKNLFVSTNAHYYGKRDDLFFNSSTFMTEAVKLKSYVLWDAYAEYSFFKKRLKCFAQVNNLLNEDYYEVYGYTTLKRNYSTGIRFSL